MLLTLPNANAKFAKNIGSKIRIVGLSLAQHKLSGKNTCAHATPACSALCVGKQGLAGVFSSIVKARVAKTLRLVSDPVGFRAELWRDIDKQRRVAQLDGATLAVRLNTFSDLPWETTDRQAIVSRQDVRFFDYTKSERRYRKWLAGEFPSNYHLTFSRSENTPDSLVRELVALGGTVAVPFRIARSKPMATHWLGIPVVDGDKTDYRPADPMGCIVGLRAKGSAKQDNSGFVVDVE